MHHDVRAAGAPVVTTTILTSAERAAAGGSGSAAAPGSCPLLDRARPADRCVVLFVAGVGGIVSELSLPDSYPVVDVPGTRQIELSAGATYTLYVETPSGVGGAADPRGGGDRPVG